MPCFLLGAQHKFRSLAKSEKKFAKDYDELINQISKQHDEFTKKQKDTEVKFSDLVDEYNEEEKLKFVDLVAEQQVG